MFGVLMKILLKIIVYIYWLLHPHINKPDATVFAIGRFLLNFSHHPTKYYSKPVFTIVWCGNSQYEKDSGKRIVTLSYKKRSAIIYWMYGKKCSLQPVWLMSFTQHYIKIC